MAGLTYLIPVGETISTAWNKVKGTKGSIWAAIFVLILINIGLWLIKYFIASLIPNLEGLLAFVIQVIMFLLQMGMLYIGIQRAMDLPFDFRLMFTPFQSNLWVKIIGTYILQVIVMLPFVILFIVPFVIQAAMPDSGPAFIVAVLLGIIAVIGIIYVAVRMYLAMAFVLDKKSGSWQSIKLSFKSTRGNFWRIIALLILELLIIAVSLIPLGIGLIWTAPFAYILYGVIYRNLSFNLSNQS